MQGQTNGCGLEIIDTEIILESENRITILVEVQSSNIEADGIAYLVNSIDLQSFGADIFWFPSLFSIHSDDLTFQVAISGTSTSVVSFPDELELSGRIVLSFNEYPIPSHDINIEALELDTVLTNTVDSELDGEEFVIIDTSIVVLDSAIIPIDTLLIEVDTAIVQIDTLTVEVDTLSLIDNSGVEIDDSLLLVSAPLMNDSILIGNDLFLLADFPNLCELNYVYRMPVDSESDAAVNEVKISNDSNIDKNKNELPSNFGSIFDNETLKIEDLSINVFPNPAVEYFYIHSQHLNKINENSKVIVYATNGDIVIEKDLSKTNYLKIDAQNLPEGLYFVLLANNNEAGHFTKLIIK